MVTTVKLVVIGSSGVGKTSLRGKYLSGCFSNGYRATIGADFITKTLPHPTDPNQSITLQIWDTAGQERFSSLSTAFFRGADAALLMFDVNTPDTMLALKKWWDEFCDGAPVADEDINEYCCVVVGNKIDAVTNGRGFGLVSKSDALAFLDELVPPSSSASIYPSPSLAEQDVDHPVFDSLTLPPSYEASSQSSSSLLADLQTHSDSIDIHQPNHISRLPSPSCKLPQSRSHLSPHFYSETMTSTRTTLTIYHTPSSSFYHSVRSSPESLSPSEPTSPTSSCRQRKLNTRSSGSTSSGSAPTITPSIYARNHGSSSNTNISDNLLPTTQSPSTPSHCPAFALPPPPERGPKLFFTSAKTGEGVADVFEYIAHRVSRKWEYEERIEARRMHYRDSSAAETIRLGLDNWGSEVGSVVRDGGGRSRGCCSS
ncbi:ras-domain-containing protein [Phlegmacium glaucopus]|nr:ras-domain-containing protein [Phlegmacium glaucopus]